MRESNKISANCTQFNDVSSIEDAALQIVFVEMFICHWKACDVTFPLSMCNYNEIRIGSNLLL